MRVMESTQDELGGLEKPAKADAVSGLEDLPSFTDVDVPGPALSRVDDEITVIAASAAPNWMTVSAILDRILCELEALRQDYQQLIDHQTTEPKPDVNKPTDQPSGGYCPTCLLNAQMTSKNWESLISLMMSTSGEDTIAVPTDALEESMHNMLMNDVKKPERSPRRSHQEEQPASRGGSRTGRGRRPAASTGPVSSCQHCYEGNARVGVEFLDKLMQHDRRHIYWNPEKRWMVSWMDPDGRKRGKSFYQSNKSCDGCRKEAFMRAHDFRDNVISSSSMRLLPSGSGTVVSATTPARRGRRPGRGRPRGRWAVGSATTRSSRASEEVAKPMEPKEEKKSTAADMEVKAEAPSEQAGDDAMSSASCSSEASSSSATTPASSTSSVKKRRADPPSTRRESRSTRNHGGDGGAAATGSGACSSCEGCVNLSGEMKDEGLSLDDLLREDHASIYWSSDQRWKFSWIDPQSGRRRGKSFYPSNKACTGCKKLAFLKARNFRDETFRLSGAKPEDVWNEEFDTAVPSPVQPSKRQKPAPRLSQDASITSRDRTTTRAGSGRGKGLQQPDGECGHREDYETYHHRLRELMETTGASVYWYPDNRWLVSLKQSNGKRRGKSFYPTNRKCEGCRLDAFVKAQEFRDRILQKRGKDDSLDGLDDVTLKGEPHTPDTPETEPFTPLLSRTSKERTSEDAGPATADFCGVTNRRRQLSVTTTPSLESAAFPDVDVKCCASIGDVSETSFSDHDAFVDPLVESVADDASVAPQSSIGPPHHKPRVSRVHVCNHNPELNNNAAAVVSDQLDAEDRGNIYWNADQRWMVSWLDKEGRRRGKSFYPPNRNCSQCKALALTQARAFRDEVVA